MAFLCIIINVKHAVHAMQINLFESQVTQSQGDVS